MRPVLHHAIALLAVLISAVLPARAEQPRDFVPAIYQNYVGKDAKGIPVNSGLARQVITPGLMKLIDADAKAAARRGEPPRLDGDPFIDAPVNNGPMILALVKTGDAWRIDDFRGDSGSVRKYLSRKPKR